MPTAAQSVARGFNELLHDMSIHKAVIQVYNDEEAYALVDELAKYDISAQVRLPEFALDELDLNVRVYLDTADSTASYLYYAGKNTYISLVYVRDKEAMHMLDDVAPHLVMHRDDESPKVA